VILAYPSGCPIGEDGPRENRALNPGKIVGGDDDSGGFFTGGQTTVETRTCRRRGDLLFAEYYWKTKPRRGTARPLDDRFPRRRTRSAAEAVAEVRSGWRRRPTERGPERTRAVVVLLLLLLCGRTQPSAHCCRPPPRFINNTKNTIRSYCIIII